METTLEDYIASNVELQETINCVKAQMKQSKLGKNLLKSLSDSTLNSEGDDDIMQLCIDEEDPVLWKGPSSQKPFLSLNNAQQSEDEDDEFEKMYSRLNSNLKQTETKQANDDQERVLWRGLPSRRAFLNFNSQQQDDGAEEFELMYSKLNSNLKQVDNVQAVDEPKQTKDDFDLREIIERRRLDATDLPSVTSQQWRLREPNLGAKRPAGMPPLVPCSLLEKLTHADNQKMKTNMRNRNKKRWQYKNNSFSKRHNENYKDKAFNRELPKVWDVPPIGNKNHMSAIDDNSQSLPAAVPNENAILQNIALITDGFGGVQCLPLGAILNTGATYPNANIGGCALASSTPYRGYNENLLLNSNGAAGCYNLNSDNGQSSVSFARSNLHGIRGGGRVERLLRSGSQNNYILQQALKRFLNPNDSLTDNCPPMNENMSATSSTSQSMLLAAAVENVLKQGITIKLVKSDREN